MVARQQSQREFVAQRAAEFVETNPTKNWPKVLSSLGCGDTSDSYLLLQQVIDLLHPANARRCVGLARERGLALQA